MKTRDTHVHTPCRPARAATLVVLVAAWLPLSDAGAQTAFGQPQSVSASGAADIRAVLDRYCVGCHNERLLTGGLALDTLDAANPAAAPERWERVIQKLRTGTMPPAGRPRPDIATYHAVAGRLEAAIDASAAADPDPGRTSTVHRLNRTEYRHAIRDLLALDIDVTALLPGDETSDTGFDNNADVLSISTAHLERYLSAARHITRLATGLPPTGPGFETFEVPLLLLQDDRQSPDLPLGSRGGTVVRYNFPVEGEYLIKIRLRTNWQDYILGMGTAQQLDVRIDGALAKRFTVGGGTTGRPAPATFTIAEPGDPEWETYVLNADDDLEVRVQVMAGPRVVGVSFVRRVWEPEGVFQAHQAGEVLSNDEAYYGNAAVDSVSIGGPYNMTGASDTPSRRAIFVCRPAAPSDEGPCAARILSRLARRAYRRPVRDDDRETLLGFFQRGRAEGGSFDAGVQLALERLLVDPDFLLRVEADPAGVAPGDVYRLSDLEVASRLSFFLWSSLPDEPLLVDAERGTLTDPAVLDRQARRLLADPRAASLVEDFATQWLHLRNLSEVRGDPVPFPDFDDNLVEAFQTETELFLTSTLRQDTSVLELLSADYTFVNERLAQHYGIPNVYGSQFRRVTLRTEERRGLLGHGSVLTVTSYPNRTSPVLRGKWLLDNFLGTPPPAPPPNIPALEEDTATRTPSSVRERLEAHRRSPSCAVCHDRMDPLGFALENFDAIGRWRTLSESKTPIDATGQLPNGDRFEGPVGLRAQVLKSPAQFATTITDKLLMYALGRSVEASDAPTVRAIVREAARDDYRFSTIVLGIVNSTPFQMRKSS